MSASGFIRSAFYFLLATGEPGWATPGTSYLADVADSKLSNERRLEAAKALVYEQVPGAEAALGRALRGARQPLFGDLASYLADLETELAFRTLTELAVDPAPRAMPERRLLLDAARAMRDTRRELLVVAWARALAAPAFQPLSRELLDEMRSMLGDPDRGKEAGNETYPALLRLLDHPRSDVRFYVAEFLATARNDEEARRAARAALASLVNSPPPTGDWSIEADLRGRATHALDSLGVEVASLFPPLWNFAQGLLEAPNFKETERMFAYEALRSRLPPMLRNRLDAEFRKRAASKLQQSAPSLDPCEVVCNLVRQGGEWSKEEFFTTPEFIEPRDAWSTATRALAALFIAKAAPFCPEAKAIFDKITRLWFMEAPPPNPLRGGKTSSRSLSETIQAGFGSDLSPEQFQRLTDFQGRATGAPPVDGSSVYAKQFLSLLLREALQRPNLTAEQRKLLQTRLDESEAEHASYLKGFRQSLSGRSGSLFNTYALASSVLAISHAPQEAMDAMAELVRTAGGPTQIPYNVDKPSDTPRAGAARSVVVHLARYEKAQDREERRLARKDLVAALENYVRHLPDLTAHLARNRTHMGVDALAPYYFYPTVAYATSAIALLDSESTDPAEKAKLMGFESAISTQLTSLLRPDGTFLAMGEDQGSEPNTYRSSAVYVNPFGGLALIPTIDQCGDQSVQQSFGILDRSIEAPDQDPLPVREDLVNVSSPIAHPTDPKAFPRGK